MNLWEKRRDQPECTNLARATEVIARIEKFVEGFDSNLLNLELESANLKETFATSVEKTTELISALYRTRRWGDSHIKSGALRCTEAVFEELKSNFEREADEFIKSHEQYPQLRAQFDESTQDITERHADFHKFVFKFERGCNKLLDGTIAWHMRKFVGKIEEAFTKARTPAEIRACMCTAIDILDLGLRAHFPKIINLKEGNLEESSINS